MSPNALHVFTPAEPTGGGIFRVSGGRLTAETVEYQDGTLTMYRPQEEGIHEISNMPSASTMLMANEMTKSLPGFRTTVGWWPEDMDGPGDRPGLVERIMRVDPFDESCYTLLSSETEFLDDDFVRFNAAIGSPTMLLSHTPAQQISCLRAYFEPLEPKEEGAFWKIMDPAVMPGEMERDPSLTVCILSRDDDYILPLELLIRGERALRSIQSYIEALPDLYIVSGDGKFVRGTGWEWKFEVVE